jgi:hypothetical protein
VAGKNFCHLYFLMRKIGIKFFVGRASSREIRKAHEMGLIDSVSPHPTLILRRKIDFIPYAYDGGRPKGDQRIRGRRGFIGRLDDISPMGTDGVRRISVTKSLCQTGRRFLRNKKKGGPLSKGPLPLSSI